MIVAINGHGLGHATFWLARNSIKAEISGRRDCCPIQEKPEVNSNKSYMTAAT